ncbi:MAG: hypothetical protein NTW10_02845 [Bacteroidetes bacterium]|nr:hypothetical protein [Bacteroidota bacterium]
MWGRKKKQKSILVLCLILSASANTQSWLSPDSILKEISGRKVHFRQELEGSLTFSNYLFLNWHHDKNASQVILLQNLKYVFSISADSLVGFSGSILHNLGLLSYFDSLTKVNTDDNTLNSRFDIRIWKKLNFSINSTLASRIMNGYDYSVDDSGRVVKVLNSSFCTPLLCTFSGGFSVKWRDFGSVSLGLSAAKLTWIRDKSIFKRQNTDTYYGIPEGKDHRFEYGISLQFLADKEFFKRFRWNCDLLVFKNYTAPVDVTLKNNFGIRINRFLKASIQTRVIYEEKVSRSIQLENLVTFGFYVHL